MYKNTKEKHAIQPSNALTDIIIGLSDGLTVPFAFTAGLSSISNSTNAIIIAGITVTIAGAILLALGGYLAGSTNHPKELPEKLGLSEEVQKLMAEDNAKDQKEWEELIIKNKATLVKPNAAIIGASYIIGGLVPVIPYCFIDPPLEALKVSAVITLLCLFVFGFFKSRVTGLNPWTGALRVTLIGAVAAAAAFGVAKIFVA